MAGSGADLRGEAEVTNVRTHEGCFHASTDEESYEMECLILATGVDRSLLEDLGCALDEEVVDVDVTMETSVAGAYASGAMVRGEW